MAEPWYVVRISSIKRSSRFVMSEGDLIRHHQLPTAKGYREQRGGGRMAGCMGLTLRQDTRLARCPSSLDHSPRAVS